MAMHDFLAAVGQYSHRAGRFAGKFVLENY